MKLIKYLSISHIVTEIIAQDKPSVLEALVRVLVDHEKLPGEMVEEVMNGLMERESLTSTGLGYGVALPHIKTNAVEQIHVVFGRNTKGIDFDALDGNPVHFFFLILAPTKLTDEYLKVISNISGLMKDEKTRQNLAQAQSTDEIYKILSQSI